VNRREKRFWLLFKMRRLEGHQLNGFVKFRSLQRRQETIFPLVVSMWCLALHQLDRGAQRISLRVSQGMPDPHVQVWNDPRHKRPLIPNLTALSHQFRTAGMVGRMKAMVVAPVDEPQTPGHAPPQLRASDVCILVSWHTGQWSVHVLTQTHHIRV